jgi:phosphoserine phosphatase
MTAERPLILDLDGTLLRTDTLVEQVLRLAASAPITLVAAGIALRHGRAAFKRRVAAAGALDPATLVYNDEILALAQQARAAGRAVYLVTAADQSVADAVATHLGLFDGVYASDGTRNLKGEAKAAFLVDRFGAGNFDYAGDASADLAVWKSAARAIVVAPDAELLRRARAVNSDVEVLGTPPGMIETLRL